MHRPESPSLSAVRDVDWESSVSLGMGDEFKELVRSSTSLVDLVSETVALKPLRGGSDYVGLCPFHEDKNPSLHVYPDRQSYRCWVCDAGGDCFRWVMEMEKVPFPEAIEGLARRANLEIPKQNSPHYSAESEQRKNDSYAILEWAASLMQHSLIRGNEAANARDYVSKRNLNAETVRNFRIGYHPEEWNWFLEKARGRFTPQQLVSAGLVQERSNGQGHFDNLVGRLVFPILDERGRIVAFGGRLLPGGNIESDAKYWNSRESGIFHKSRMLYAFDRARQEIRKCRIAVVVEGYMDVIACHQAGVTNVVATLGTALTEEHVRFLRRSADRVVLTYDGDDPGQKAAERSITRFLGQDLDLRILTLAEGKDPADYLENNTADDLRQLIQSAPEAWEYKLQMISGRYGNETINARQQILNEMLELLVASTSIRGTVREDLILRTVCQRVQVDERVARRQLLDMRSRQQGESQRKIQRDQLRRDQESQGTTPTKETDAFQDDPVNQISVPAIRLAEQELLEIILTCPEFIDVIRHLIGPDDFEDARHRRLLELCIDLRKEEGDLPEISRLVVAADSDSALLSLMNAVMDSAEQKDILNLMKEVPEGAEPGEDQGIPMHLQRVLQPLLFRREKQRTLLSKQQLAQSDNASSELNNDQKDALRQMYSFRLNQMGQRINLK
ncbi:MAG: DNA primase [Planctomycetaceae bacterium]|nr:DNA primase [Planctomycetaceae bacterium]